MSYDYQRLQMDQQLLEAMAINAEIESMKTANQQRAFLGEAVAYDEKAFEEKANQLWGMSQSAIDISRG